MEDFDVSDSDNSLYSHSDDFDLHCHLFIAGSIDHSFGHSSSVTGPFSSEVKKQMLEVSVHRVVLLELMLPGSVTYF